MATVLGTFGVLETFGLLYLAVGPGVTLLEILRRVYKENVVYGVDLMALLGNQAGQIGEHVVQGLVPCLVEV